MNARVRSNGNDLSVIEKDSVEILKKIGKTITVVLNNGKEQGGKIFSNFEEVRIVVLRGNRRCDEVPFSLLHCDADFSTCGCGKHGGGNL